MSRANENPGRHTIHTVYGFTGRKQHFPGSDKQFMQENVLYEDERDEGNALPQ
jgi:hypothetical protein